MPHARKAAAGLGLLLAAGLLGGCSGHGEGASLNPVDWWHNLEGGRIAEARPPPPNADAPYPNLGSVPAKPPPPDAAAHARIANALIADRGNAHYAQTALPLPVVRPPAGTPTRTLAQGARPADAEQPNASLAAASAPPQPPEPAAAPAVRKVPVAPVSAAPLAAPVGVPVAAPAGTPAAAPAETAAMPDIPAAPPAPPQLPGAPPAATAPTPPPVAPPAAPPAAPALSGQAVAIPFVAGSAVLPAEALAPIKALANRRGGASIAVTGFGEATSTDPGAQTAALPLAYDRARAVAAMLMADGVPGGVIRIAAEPHGSGAAARLVN